MTYHQHIIKSLLNKGRGQCDNCYLVDCDFHWYFEKLYWYLDRGGINVPSH